MRITINVTDKYYNDDIKLIHCILSSFATIISLYKLIRYHIYTYYSYIYLVFHQLSKNKCYHCCTPFLVNLDQGDNTFDQTISSLLYYCLLNNVSNSSICIG